MENNANNLEANVDRNSILNALVAPLEERVEGFIREGWKAEKALDVVLHSEEVLGYHFSEAEEETLEMAVRKRFHELSLERSRMHTSKASNIGSGRVPKGLTAEERKAALFKKFEGRENLFSGSDKAAGAEVEAKKDDDADFYPPPQLAIK